MSDKQFPPSDQKLQKLRSEGVFPWSFDLLTASLFGGFLVAWYSFPKETFMRFFADSLSVSESSAKPDISPYFWALLVPVLVLALIVWIIQTRAFLRYGRRNRKSRPNFSQRLPLAALSVLKLLFFSIAFATLYYSHLGLLLAENRLGQDQSFFSALAQTPLRCTAELPFCPTQDLVFTRFRRDFSVVSAVLGATCILSFLLGILSRFVAGLNFIREHRMSRGEVEAEAREAESPPQLRDYRNEQEFLEEV